MTNPPKTSQIHGLAIAFARVLHSWLSTEEMAAVVKRNRDNNDDDKTCASHDFCDSNMALLEAYRQILGEEPCFASDVESGAATEAEEANDVALMNAAWAQAKSNDFNVDRLTAAGDQAVLEEATQAALDVAAREIQDYLGVKTGDFAGLFFSGSNSGELTDLLRRYLAAQRSHA